MVREANGQYDSIRAKFVRRCNFSGSHELQFLNMRKAFYSFYRNLAQLSAEKTTSKDFQNATVFICRFIFRNTADIQGVIYTSEGDFSCLSLEAVMFCFLVSFQQFTFRSTSNQLAASTHMDIISLFIDV